MSYCFNRYKSNTINSLYSDIDKQLMSINAIVIVSVMVLEVAYMFMTVNLKGFNYELQYYLLYFILKPFSFNLLIYAIGDRVIKSGVSGFRSASFIDTIPLLVLVGILQVTLAVHFVFPVLYSVPCICIIVSIIYGNKQITKTIFSVTFVTSMCAFQLTYLEGKSIAPSRFIFNVIITLLVYILVYIFSLKVINFECRKFELITNYEKENSNLNIISKTDGLTKLWNHEALSEKADIWVKSEDIVHYIMFDIDNFKSINDTYGHLFGDVVLKRLANILLSVSSDDIFVARYGGEEFGILVRNKSDNDVLSIAESIRAEFEKQSYRETERRFTVSGGISKFSSGHNVKSFFKVADSNLYRAKSCGKNKIAC